MALRVTPDEVKTIIDTDLTNLMPFIKAANLIVDNVLASDSNMAAGQLEQIELWLAAHFIAVRDPVARSEAIGETRIEYWLGTVDGATGLKMTPYGQMACALDTSGKLTSVSLRRADFSAIDLGL
jgi:hypothetical protein